jgi:hypothetical protein
MMHGQKNIKLKWILMKYSVAQDMDKWQVVVSLVMYLCFRKMQEVSRLLGEILASQEGLHTMVLVKWS